MRKIKKIDFKSQIPNFITLAGLSFGLSSIRFSLDYNFEVSVICLLLASACDALDGFFSRILKSESELGAELDSLSDFLSFAVAPCILIYMSLIDENEVIGSIALLLFVVFSCIRLAVFNLNKDSDQNVSSFFNGVPTPAGCGLLILPLVQSFLGFIAKENEILLSIYIFIIGFLLRHLPTFSKQFKKKISRKIIYIFHCSFFLFIFTDKLMIAINVMGIVYLLSIPVS